MSSENQRPYWLVPARDLAPPPSAYEKVRPLTEAEQVELRSRLNAFGGSRQVLTASERDYLARAEPVRDMEQVARLRARLEEAEPTDEFAAGVGQALAFAAGEREGPVSGDTPAHHPPVGADLGVEEALVQRLLRGEPPAADRPPRPRAQAFLVGVEHTLMWLRCRTDQEPLPLDPGRG